MVLILFYNYLMIQTNKDIYNHKASVSGFSNLSTASASVSEAINFALSKCI